MTATLNGKPQRKQLSDQLDRLTRSSTLSRMRYPKPSPTQLVKAHDKPCEEC
jgi:hypothetical protein